MVCAALPKSGQEENAASTVNAVAWGLHVFHFLFMTLNETTIAIGETSLTVTFESSFSFWHIMISPSCTAKRCMFYQNCNLIGMKEKGNKDKIRVLSTYFNYQNHVVFFCDFQSVICGPKNSIAKLECRGHLPF